MRVEPPLAPQVTTTETGFAGSIGMTVHESVPAWPGATAAEAKRPNVVCIVLDDVGFAQLGVYGASIETPNIDALAGQAQVFNSFHVTPLCSPTRAALLTGRNNHSVGMGFLADFDTGFPSYRGRVSTQAGTLAEILGSSGYGCYAAGKWHLTAPVNLSPAGRFEDWPTGRGFDRFFGFMGGEDDQWNPELWEDQHRVDGDWGASHLSEQLVDKSIRYISDHVSAAPERPFFMYLAFGAGHAPHQAPPEYIEKYRGAFDHGWDEERERILARQIAAGIVPAGTSVPDSNPGVQAWDDLSPDERRLAARMQEVFAGFMDHTDAHIGRLRTFLKSHDLDDDTIIILLSDNGASGEGGDHGMLNEYSYFLGVDESFETILANIDKLGGPEAHNHYPAGWAQAGNTPLRYFKRFTYGGGVRTPLIWKNHAGADIPTGVVENFCHVSDIVPTLLRQLDLPAPSTLAGVTQMPLHGREIGSITGADTSARTQYFESGGFRGLYQDGWKAVSLHEPGADYADDEWHLYYLPEDFAESKDLAAEHPERLQQMVARWFREAERFDVFPLDDRGKERVSARPRSSLRESFRFLPGTQIPNGLNAPAFGFRSFTLTAALKRDRGQDGVLFAYGRRASGFSWFFLNDHLHFELNAAGRRSRVVSKTPLGHVTTVSVTLEGDESGATATLRSGEEILGRAEFETLMPAGFGTLSAQTGFNAPSAVSYAYQAPFAFQGELKQVDIVLAPRGDLTDAAEWHRAVQSE